MQLDDIRIGGLYFSLQLENSLELKGITEVLDIDTKLQENDALKLNVSQW